jgi:hypothetical protein
MTYDDTDRTVSRIRAGQVNARPALAVQRSSASWGGSVRGSPVK